MVRDTPPGKPYGFISVWHHNVTLFYHYNDVLPSSKESVKRHTAVAFSIASWSQGFKAEKVRPLTAAEQKNGAKDTRMSLLRCHVKKWDAGAREGTIQLSQQPCTLPFSASPPLSGRITNGCSLVCKIDGKGKDLVATHLQLPKEGPDPRSPAASPSEATTTRGGRKTSGEGVDGPKSPNSAAVAAEARAPLAGNREHGPPGITPPKTGGAVPSLAPSSASSWPPATANLGISVSAAVAAAAESAFAADSGSSSSSPNTHASPDRHTSNTSAAAAAFEAVMKNAPSAIAGAPPGLGNLALPTGLGVPAPAAAGLPPGMGNGSAFAGSLPTAPSLKMPVLPPALQNDAFGGLFGPLGGSSSADPPSPQTAAAPPPAVPQRSDPRSLPAPLFPSVGGTGWGMPPAGGAAATNPFASTNTMLGAPPPTRTQSLPVPQMPIPSMFPFNAGGWGGAGDAGVANAGWGGAANTNAAAALPTAPPPANPFLAQQGLDPASAEWANPPPPVVDAAARAKSAGPAGGYSLF